MQWAVPAGSASAKPSLLCSAAFTHSPRLFLCQQPAAVMAEAGMISGSIERPGSANEMNTLDEPVSVTIVCDG